MQLEDYFDFQAANDIRLKGSRVGIETILFDYLELGLFPEDLVVRYPTLSLEQVYATITYYWHNKAQIDTYLREWQKHGDRMREKQDRNPSPGVLRLREIIRQRQLETEAQSGSHP